MGTTTLDSLFTTLATAYGGPLAGVLASAVIKVGTAELEKRAGKKLNAMSREEALALLDSLEIGSTAAEIAAGEALAEPRNPEAGGTPDSSS